MPGEVWKAIGWINQDTQLRWVGGMPSPLLDSWPTPVPRSEIVYTTIELDIDDDDYFYKLVEMFAGPGALADLKQSEHAQAVWESEGGSYL